MSEWGNPLLSAIKGVVFLGYLTGDCLILLKIHVPIYEIGTKMIVFFPLFFCGLIKVSVLVLYREGNYLPLGVWCMAG